MYVCSLVVTQILSGVERNGGGEHAYRLKQTLGVHVCSFVVTQILSGESRETVVENIHTKLQEVGEKVRSNELSKELYYITKVTPDC